MSAFSFLRKTVLAAFVAAFGTPLFDPALNKPTVLIFGSFT